MTSCTLAEYEMVKNQTVDVRFNELSNYFAAVIEIWWAYDLFGKTNWHSYHCTYTGTYFDSDLNIATSEQYEDEMTNKQIEAFWANNWNK